VVGVASQLCRNDWSMWVEWAVVKVVLSCFFSSKEAIRLFIRMLTYNHFTNHITCPTNNATTISSRFFLSFSRSHLSPLFLFTHVHFSAWHFSIYEFKIVMDSWCWYSCLEDPNVWNRLLMMIVVLTFHICFLLLYPILSSSTSTCSCFLPFSASKSNRFLLPFPPSFFSFSQSLKVK